MIKFTIKLFAKKYLPNSIRKPINYTVSIIKKLYYYSYVGTKFKCPFCGFHFRKGIPSGLNEKILKEKQVVSGGYRLNALCPRCGSVDRVRLILLYLKNKTNIFNDRLRILHVAPENYLKNILLSNKKIDYVSVDVNPKVAMMQMDITDIKFHDNTFDVIICSHVLEHIIDDKKAIAELFRVLKAGGFAILQVPISEVLEKTFEDPEIATDDMRLKAYGQNDHVRIYGQDYYDRIRSVGFEIELYSTDDVCGNDGPHKYALIEKEKVVIAKKRKF